MSQHIEDFILIGLSFLIGVFLLENKKFSKKILALVLIIYFLGMFLDSFSTWIMFEFKPQSIRAERNPIVRELYGDFGSMSAFMIFTDREYWTVTFIMFLGSFIPLATASKIGKIPIKNALLITFLSLGIMRFMVAITNFIIFLKI